ncbi:PREDICTED: CCR4-NOT transcription complex subunit 2-like isoform X2 [Priapulus caudatus]|uniref:CCR4-NOT transcription complex subunit 2-like isoform X2 n=1 Tax=Priapulus caudatus TaxID=37621 RepID=A0ABM1EQP2_PRICU|nr:PREDICTED: CCR4-NOT transcription complex subunit 2-like isoform X2 [Priapulus caudatus]
MAFSRNPLDSMAGSGQRFGVGGMDTTNSTYMQDQFSAWSAAQYGMSSGRKSAPADSLLSPGTRKSSGLIGSGSSATTVTSTGAERMSKLKRGGFYGDDDDSEPSIYFNNPSMYLPHRTDKDSMTSPSPSQLSAFGTSSLIGSQSGSSQLQQRTIGQQFGRSTSVPGHVTPTSVGASSFLSGLPQQQPSPNRVMLPISSRSSFQTQIAPPLGNLQKSKSPAFPLVSSSSSSSSSAAAAAAAAAAASSGMQGFGFSSRSFTAQAGSSFSSQGEGGPAGLDLSEFPSLKSGASNSTPPMQSNAMMGRTAYGEHKLFKGMIKQPTSESQQEFQIHNEDFPALPGSQIQGRESVDSTKPVAASAESEQGRDGKPRFPGDKQGSQQQQQQQQKRGIQTSPDGNVTNLPASMVQDQFGIVGLLTFIRAAESDPNLVSLALGSDLTTLGLNLNSQENLYPTFGGPWAEAPCRPQDIDFHVPQEYLCNIAIRDKLAPIKLNRYGEDLLFYMFYTHGGDVLQLAAAAELYNRDWRYHKEERVWISRAPGMIPIEKTAQYERGTYYFFDAQNWRKVAKEFHLDYDKLEDRPHLPQSMHPHPNQMSAFTVGPVQ